MNVAIIPARYASTRFPGKPLADIAGQSMISRVYQQARKATKIDHVVVATDDKRIYDHVVSFGGKALMTSINHDSGTDRCFEAYKILDKKYDYLINVQGDEPFIDPGQIDALAETLNGGKTEIATLIGVVKRKEILEDPGEVKVVIDSEGRALYFSRQAIPYIRGVGEAHWTSHHDFYYHIGLYAYRTDILGKITRLPVSGLEKAESLEQLRWMENGYHIKCVITDKESYCIEEPGDITKVLKKLKL